MSDDIATKIAELEATLQMPGLPTAAREALEQQLRALHSQIVQQQSGGANFGVGTTIGQTSDIIAGDQARGTVDNQGRIDGVAVGVNLGTVIYGRDPSEDQRRRLVWYLEGLQTQLYYLPLRGLDERLNRGEGIALPQVYIMLATESLVEVARGYTKELRRYYQDGKLDQPLKPEYTPDYALPDRAVVRVDAVNVARREPERNLPLALSRSMVATEAVQQHWRLVLLGDPGSGKSTFVRHLAWALAQRELRPAQVPAPFGWDERRAYLPLLLPLRTLATRLAHEGASEATVYAALHDAMLRCCTHQVDDALSEALHNGAALLLFDGLDEVPPEGAPGVADRLTTLRAVREIARRYQSCHAILTCRTRAFDSTLQLELGWKVEALAPLTLGQVRHFVPAWYSELVAKGQISPAQADNLSLSLERAILDPARPRLREMTATPLLLTLMALILYNKGELPRDRPQLYERMLELLLGQWDAVRDGQSLGQVIGKPEWDSSYFCPPLDQLSYEAHRDATSKDGRGRLDRGKVYIKLRDFFKHAKVERPGDAADRCLEYIEQRSGLLAPEDNEGYVFAHLTIQEHCVGRYIALGSDDPIGLIMQHRAEDRWREPIFLGAGLLRPAELNALLSDLIDREEGGRTKPIERWYDDLILAAEIGNDRDWDYLRTRPMVKVERLQRDLRRGLVRLLQDAAQPLPVARRVRAGFLLGDLGDQRFPVTLDQWRHEVALAQQGNASGYFCHVEAGTYTIGCADDDPDAEEDEKPRHSVAFDAPFWIARYPITNIQWQEWVQAGGIRSRLADEADLTHPNQPVVGVSWRMCNEFCAWLSTQLGLTVRLPTEQEWEAAARGDDMRRYPWGDAWQDDRAATEEDQGIRGAAYTLPIGCYGAGVAPCGALDMAGNVWEWTASTWQSYPGAQKPFTEEGWYVLRGGGWGNTRKRVRCGARYGGLPYDVDYGGGFRVVCAPPLAQMF